MLDADIYLIIYEIQGTTSVQFGQIYKLMIYEETNPDHFEDCTNHINGLCKKSRVPECYYMWYICITLL